MPKPKPERRNTVGKAFSHPLRVRIVEILGERTSSPKLLSREIGEQLNLVAYHVRALKEFGCIELVKTEPRCGATEHFYRASTLIVAGGLKN